MNDKEKLTLPQGARRRKPHNTAKKRFNHQHRLEEHIGRDITIWDNDSARLTGQLVGCDSFTVTIRLEDGSEMETPNDLITIFKHAIAAFCIHAE